MNGASTRRKRLSSTIPRCRAKKRPPNRWQFPAVKKQSLGSGFWRARQNGGVMARQAGIEWLVSMAPGRRQISGSTAIFTPNPPSGTAPARFPTVRKTSAIGRESCSIGRKSSSTVRKTCSTGRESNFIGRKTCSIGRKSNFYARKTCSTRRERNSIGRKSYSTVRKTCSIGPQNPLARPSRAADFGQNNAVKHMINKQL